MSQLHAVVHGHVQGVSFRYYTVREAERRSLKGWVRNCADGTVETLAVGPRDVLQNFLQWLHHGPPSASVWKVDVEWSDIDSPFDAFEIAYD